MRLVEVKTSDKFKEIKKQMVELHRKNTLAVLKEKLEEATPENCLNDALQLAIRLIEEQQALIFKLTKKSTRQKYAYKNLQKAHEAQVRDLEDAKKSYDIMLKMASQRALQRDDAVRENKVLRNAFKVLQTIGIGQVDPEAED